MRKAGDKIIKKWQAKLRLYAGTVDPYTEPNYWRQFIEVNRN